MRIGETVPFPEVITGAKGFDQMVFGMQVRAQEIQVITRRVIPRQMNIQPSAPNDELDVMLVQATNQAGNLFRPRKVRVGQTENFGGVTEVEEEIEPGAMPMEEIL
jgi:hypothetical protein